MKASPTLAGNLQMVLTGLAEQLAWMGNAETMAPSAAVTEPAEK